MQFTRVTLALLILQSVALTGCSLKPVRLYPIEQTDIISVKQGENLKAPKNGYFLSDEYVAEVLKAKVGK